MVSYQDTLIFQNFPVALMVILISFWFATMSVKQGKLDPCSWCRNNKAIEG